MAHASRQLLASIISRGLLIFFFFFKSVHQWFTGTQHCAEHDILTTHICIFHVNKETDTKINVDKTEIH